MKSKRKHFFGILLSLALMFTIMAVPGMIQTVYGEEGLYMTKLELPEYWKDDQNPLTEDDLTGFKTCTLEEAKAWTEVPSGNTTLFYSHSGNEWAYVYFKDGKYENEGSRSITKGEIKAQSEYYFIYYTSAALYPLWVDGVMVTGANADNVLPGGDNDGKVSFTPATDDTPATLTLNGANISSGAHDGAGIYYADANNELVIDATTASTVTGPNYGDNSYGILSDGDLTLKGELTARGGRL